MKNVLKIIYGLVKILPLVGEILEIFANRKETPTHSTVFKSDKDIIDDV